jgi:hypothetical protein
VKRLPAAFYQLPSGREPVHDWLKAVSDEDRKIVGEDIKDVEPWPIGMPLCRAIMGSSQRLDWRPHCSRPVLHSRGKDGPFARLHKENAEGARR